MNKWVKTSAIFIVSACSTLAQADVFNYEVFAPSHTATTVYPGLDLNGLEKIVVRAENSDFDPEIKITRLQLAFPNATDLIVNNLTLNSSGTYRGVVNGAWVYKQVAVEVDAPQPITPQSQINVRLFIVEHQSNINHPEMSFGYQILDANGILEDVSPNRLADTNAVTVDNERLILRLFKRAQSSYQGQGFKVETNWLGNGERTLYLPAPFTPEEYHRYSAVGIDIDTFTHPDGLEEHNFQIRYEDEFGTVQTTPLEPLRPYLDTAYPPQQ